MKSKLKAMTQNLDKVSREIRCSILIGPSEIDPAIGRQLAKPFVAIWDTGAAGSVITQCVVDALELEPVGVTVISGVDGLQESAAYLVNFYLPTMEPVVGLRVTLAKLVGLDALIGMDIIMAGDFAITNYGNSTVVTYCTPSRGTIDFARRANNW